MVRFLGGGHSRRVAVVIGAALLAVAASCGVEPSSPAWARSDAAVSAAQAVRHPGCTKRTGRGFAPTEHFARLKAWETVAQATGNLPFQSDEFRSTTYRCRADRNGRLCFVAIEVCRRG